MLKEKNNNKDETVCLCLLWTLKEKITTTKVNAIYLNWAATLA
jgi:hypothetical protein